MLTPGRTREPPTRSGSYSDSAIRLATASALRHSVRSTTNSSPPSRATVSCGRTQLRSRLATSTSSSSAEERPSMSLRFLKSSRFSSSTSTGSGRRSAAARRSLNRVPLGSEVSGSRSTPARTWSSCPAKAAGTAVDAASGTTAVRCGVRRARRARAAVPASTGRLPTWRFPVSGNGRCPAPRTESATDRAAGPAPASGGSSEQVISTGSSVPSARRPAPAKGWPERGAGPRQAGEDAVEGLRGRPRPGAGRVGAQQLCPGVAEELLRGGVQEGDGPVRIEQQQRVRAVLQQQLCESRFHVFCLPPSDGCEVAAAVAENKAGCAH